MSKKKLRLMIKGYKTLKRENRLDFIERLRDVLINTKLKKAHYTNSLLSNISFNFELSVRQFLTTKFLDASFNKAIIYSVGSGKPLRHPLPKEWLIALDEQKIDVDHLSSTLMWFIWSFLYWVKGAMYGIKSIYFLLKNKFYYRDYVYFDDLTIKNLPVASKQQNIITWYLQWKGSFQGVRFIAHSVKNISNYKYQNKKIVYTDGLPCIRGMKLFFYMILYFYLTFTSLLFIIYRPYGAFFLMDNLKLMRAKLATKEQLATEYLFHNTTPFYRPLWTYEAQAKGSKILFYFYSINYMKIGFNKASSVDIRWSLMSWPHYLAWNKTQSKQIKELNDDNSVVENVGVTWFSDSEEIHLNSKSRFISVFDVSPYRTSRHIYLDDLNRYYTYKMCSKFLTDIQFVLANNNINMIHKLKRKSLLLDKRFVRRVKLMKSKSNYLEANPEIEAYRIINKTEACISMPFTSTAVIAKLKGKPSAYYDPSGMIQKDDKAAHGIPILSNINELEEWVENINNE
jgi:polysaccharide biosynthesis PFTS motif protein